MTLRYRNYTRYNLFRSCLPISVIDIVASLTLLFLDEFEGNAYISAAIESGFTIQTCARSEEHTSELQSRPHISYAVFCLKKKKINQTNA